MENGGFGRPAGLLVTNALLPNMGFGKGVSEYVRFIPSKFAGVFVSTCKA